MPPNGGWEEGKLTRAKEATKSFLKRFGPLILTGLAAVAEHHWLDHKDEREEAKARSAPDERDDRHPIRKLKREVAELKRSLSRKARDDELGREARPSVRIKEEVVREWRPPYQEAPARDQLPRGRTLPDERPAPSAQYHYPQFPIAQQMQPPQVETPVQFVQVRDREYIRPSHRQRSIQRRRRHHRHSSVPNRTSHADETSVETIHAGQVAALAGAVEALHVSDIRGDWIGPKGVRVGTTMAASYAASLSRDRDPDHYRRREAVVDVGTGLLVSRLVHGPSRRLEEDERLARRRRRWSYCY